MPRRAPIAALALACALAGGGCGSEPDPEPATTAAEPAAPAEPARASALRRRFEDEIRAALRSGEAAGAVDVDCVLERLRETLPNRLVEAGAAAARRGEPIPERAVDAAFDAGSECARDPGG